MPWARRTVPSANDDVTVTHVVAARDDHVQKNSIQSNSDELADSVAGQPVVLEDSGGKRFAACAVAQLLECLSTSKPLIRKEGDFDVSLAERRSVSEVRGARDLYVCTSIRAPCNVHDENIIMYAAAFPEGGR